MTLSGRIAAGRPELDRLKPIPLGIVTHQVRQIGSTVFGRRLTAGPGGTLGHVEPDTGTYRSTAAAMTETERREAGLRRNGRRR
jgi:hypothetical protein